MNMGGTSWQQRYHASEIFTLRCRIRDVSGMLGKAITAIGQTGAHLGTLKVVGLDSRHKVRDITVYCSDQSHLGAILDILNQIEGVSVLEVKDDILEMHRRGAIETISRVEIKDLSGLQMLYTPGVAAVCHKIEADPEMAWTLTGLCDRVAIVTNGTALLGLGNKGPVVSLPVMEGKAAIFSEFARISAFPILIDSEDPDAIVETVRRIACSFGAIQLEDIAAPACFAIEAQLREALNIPVLHDDQHGTATVTLAALINALQRTDRKPEECSALILGAGAAGFAIAQILDRFGIGDIVVYDSAGPLYRGRTEKMNPYKEQLTQFTNKNNQTGDLAEGFKDKTIFIGVARPHMVTREMVTSMAPDPIVFPLSNPAGEISVEEAREAGAAVTADGRAINNALAYPGLFRGALDARATDITFEMQLAAARTLASLAPDGSLLPNMLNRDVHRAVAEAVTLAWSAPAD